MNSCYDNSYFSMIDNGIHRFKLTAKKSGTITVEKGNPVSKPFNANSVLYDTLNTADFYSTAQPIAIVFD